MTTDDGSLGGTQSPVSEVPAEAPPMSFGAKLWNLYVDPRKALASVRRNHEWVILWLILSVVVVATVVPNMPIILKEQMHQVETRLDQQQDLPPDQREAALQATEGMIKTSIYVMPPIVILIDFFFFSSVLLFVGNIIIGGKIGFLKMLNAYSWTMMVFIPSSIISMVLIMAKGSAPVSLGLGLLTTENTPAFVKGLLSSIEIFALWQVWLTAVTISVLAPTEIKKAFWSVAVIWLVWFIVKAGLAALGIQLSA